MSIVKKNFCLFLFTFLPIYLILAESYCIQSVNYKISGLTKSYILADRVPIKIGTNFTTKEQLDFYIADLQQQLNNQRVFESSEVTYTELVSNTNEIIPISLTIFIKDTWNLFIVPGYPSYNSNSGFSFKMKLKDYNFLGSMEILNASILYKAEADNENITPNHTIGLGLSFSIPFKVFNFITSWNNDFDFSYTFGAPFPEFCINEGIAIKFPIYNTALEIKLNQLVTQEIDYLPYGDNFYFTEQATISYPVTLAILDNFGSVVWGPSITATYNWDKDGDFATSNSGIIHSDLIGPTFIFGHNITCGRVDWDDNYRNGFSVNASQSFKSNLHNTSLYPSVNFELKLFKSFEKLGIASRFYWFSNMAGNRIDSGDKIRGIRDTDINTDSAIFLNLDIPIDILQTDQILQFSWLNWLHTFDFDLQISPFLDMAIGNNYIAVNSNGYSINNGWYGCGLDIHAFLHKWRSIQARLSFGVDTVQLFKMIGDQIPLVDSFLNKIMNTSWRTNRWFEIYFGIGLHY